MSTDGIAWCEYCFMNAGHQATPHGEVQEKNINHLPHITQQNNFVL
jgi:hypothetical protein